MKKILISLGFIIAFSSLASGQGSGTPSQLRVLTDANGYLAVVGATQTAPTFQSTFINTRLKTDASGYLQVIITGGPVTGPFFLPTQTDCSIVSYSFTGRTTTGLNSHAANTWNLCGGGTLGLSGNTTTVTSNLNFLFSSDGTLNIGDVGATGRPNNVYVKSVVAVNSGAGLTTAGVDVGSVNDIYWAAKVKIRSPSDGVIGFYNDAATSFGRLQFGGTTSSFPAIKRNGAGIDFRLADDSDYTTLQLSLLLFNDSTGSVGGSATTFRPANVYTSGTVNINNGTSILNSAGQLQLNAAAAYVSWGNAADNFLKRNGAGDLFLGTTSGAVNGKLTLGTTISAILQGQGTGITVANVGANSCGNTAATIVGNQISGVVTVGTVAGTQCRLTFTTAAPNTRECTVTDSTTTIATRASYVDTTNTDLFGAFVAGDALTYVCVVR